MKTITTVTVVQRHGEGTYTEGPPLDGGAGPGILAGTHHDNPRSASEIGIIVGAVAALTLTIAGMFIWRARKQKRAKANQAATNRVTIQSSNGISQPAPLPKDDKDVERCSTIENDKVLAGQELPHANSMLNWKSWGKHSQRDGGMSL